MILSHKHKFVCLNPPKTGSGFREKILEKYSDISVVFHGEQEYRHLTSLQASSFIKTINKDPNDYYWFTFVRNPWERMVSWVNMIQNHALKQGKPTITNANKNIIELLNRNKFKDYIYRDGKLLDFIGSLENITEDIGFVANKLKLDIEIGTRKDKYKCNFKDEIRSKMSKGLVKMIADAEKEVIAMKKYTH